MPGHRQHNRESSCWRVSSLIIYSMSLMGCPVAKIRSESYHSCHSEIASFVPSMELYYPAVPVLRTAASLLVDGV